MQIVILCKSLLHRLSTYGRRAFAVAGPTMFNVQGLTLCLIIYKIL